MFWSRPTSIGIICRASSRQARPSTSLKVGQVWLAWTEDPNDELTKKLKEEKGQALAALRMGLSQMQLAGDAEGAAELGSILEFFGAARGPDDRRRAQECPGQGRAAKPRYCLPTEKPVVPPGIDARFYVLGPPHDEKWLRKINPSASNKETYGLAHGRLWAVHGWCGHRAGGRRRWPSIRSAI